MLVLENRFVQIELNCVCALIVDCFIVKLNRIDLCPTHIVSAIHNGLAIIWFEFVSDENRT